MKVRPLAVLSLLLLTEGAAGQAPPAPAASPGDLLRLWLRTAATARKVQAGGEALGSPADLVCFYERRGFRPAWSDGGRLLPAATELAAAIGEAGAEGLRPEDYHLAALQKLLAAAAAPSPPPFTLAETDALLTDAFLTYGAELRSGRVPPRAVYSDCEVTPPAGDLTVVLDAALEAGRVRGALADLAPPHEGYRRLRQALAKLREVAVRGGWATVPPGPTLKPGARGPRVAALKARLAETTLPAASPAATPGAPDPLETAELDPPTVAALRAFQERHGIEPDGSVGPATLRALNVTAGERVRQIEANLERWRWLPRDLGDPHIEVNIAGFGLAVVEKGRPALTMKVIVGKTATRSPLFTSAMTHLILNPYWNVPRNILRNEIAPKARRDPSYLAREDFEVLSRPGGKPVDPAHPADIDWSSGVAVRQRPGPKNALGKVKFVFPNRFDVYLHDTPARALFSRTVRAFSHGCIRIEKPLELAEYLLRGDPRGTPEALAAALAEGHERTIRLARPVAVHVVYWTAWVDDDGTLELRPDLYKRDERLLALLR